MIKKKKKIGKKLYFFERQRGFICPLSANVAHKPLKFKNVNISFNILILGMPIV